jgi:hypothetical protein
MFPHDVLASGKPLLVLSQNLICIQELKRQFGDFPRFGLIAKLTEVC